MGPMARRRTSERLRDALEQELAQYCSPKRQEGNLDRCTDREGGSDCERTTPGAHERRIAICVVSSRRIFLPVV